MFDPAYHFVSLQQDGKISNFDYAQSGESAASPRPIPQLILDFYVLLLMITLLL
jgi:hypothetical protein